ncbi:hypothetical protein ACM26W_06560 [Halomonas sp. HK25]|uniref:hypothetical protein n=1 Tax=Halomonas sp. HK25 TaxID=3394321 RepID=UPI0039FC38A3
MSEEPVAISGSLPEAPSSPFLFDPAIFDRETPEYLVPNMGVPSPSPPISSRS